MVDFDDLEARLWTISENLHRSELTVAQRAEQVAEYSDLAKQKREAERVSGQLAQKPPGRPESGDSPELQAGVRAPPRGAMRGPGESYSDVILRLVESEAGNHAR